MKTIWLYLLCLVSLSSLGSVACKKEAKDINPNGSSELALLMRSMHEDGLAAKAKFLQGETPQLHMECEKMHTAQATDPGKVANPLYTGYANALKDKVNAFDQPYSGDKVAAYQSMVDACMNCHREICPGPMSKIKKLYLSDKEIASITVKQP